MNRIARYNDVLGIKENLNAEELRQLYRKRAKELHPDRNSDPGSHDRFILLGEAYEFYSNMLKKLNEHNKSSIFKSKKYPQHYYKEKWNVEKRMAARNRAAKRAKMKYEHYAKMGYAHRLDKLFYAIEIIKFIQAILLLTVLPAFLFQQDQFRGLGVAIFVILITNKLWYPSLKRFLPKKIGNKRW